MIFHSFDFIVFAAGLLGVYWSLNHRWQNALLLGASYVFYGYVHQWFLILIATSTVVDYLCGLGMERYVKKKKLFLVVSLFANLGMLAFFKYFGFFVGSVGAILSALGLPTFESSLHVFLPVGISFYTFQTLSYTIDIYRGTLRARRNFLDFAVFVSFFPQLVAGPIERASLMLPQIETQRHFSASRAHDAIVLIIWGFFKKLVIADNVAVIVNKVFLLPDAGFALLWTGVLGFAIQIYADFSAYTDIARGTAKLFGVELMQNFHHPYVSQTPAEFWRRWHISLSTWIRDYIYIPLGGSRVNRVREAWNLTATFFLAGLWHGASWNFVLWGLFHALLLILYRAAGRTVPRLLESQRLVVPRVLVFFALTNVGWLIFRETEITQLFFDLSIAPWENTAGQLAAAAFLLPRVLIFGLPLALHALLDRYFGSQIAEASPTHVAGLHVVIALCLLGILAFHSEVKSEFIYFQF